VVALDWGAVALGSPSPSVPLSAATVSFGLRWISIEPSGRSGVNITDKAEIAA
jgi:hypothetical protein